MVGILILTSVVLISTVVILSNRVVTYRECRVIDLDNGRWDALSVFGESAPAIFVDVMFKDRTSARIRARRGKTYAIGDRFLVKKVVYFKRYIKYQEVRG